MCVCLFGLSRVTLAFGQVKAGAGENQPANRAALKQIINSIRQPVIMRRKWRVIETLG